MVIPRSSRASTRSSSTLTAGPIPITGGSKRTTSAETHPPTDNSDIAPDSAPGAWSATKRRVARSPQALSEADRRLVAAWAADCAERVLELFEARAPDDGRPRALIARARAFARGELSTAAEIRRRFAGGVGAGEVTDPVAAAAARAAGQAVGVCHMGAHALGAAAYAAKAAGLAEPDRPEAVDEEIRWQLGHMTPGVRAALRALPRVGENPSGPLGPGLLASGELATIIRTLQYDLADVALAPDLGQGR